MRSGLGLRARLVKQAEAVAVPPLFATRIRVTVRVRARFREEAGGVVGLIL